MKKILLIAFVLLNTHFSFSQINNESSFPIALKKAESSKKIICVYLGLAKKSNFTFNSAIQNKDVAKYYNKNFVNYSYTAGDTSALSFILKYKVINMPTCIFIDHTGALIFKGSLGNNTSEHYLDMGKQALNRKASGLILSNYERRFINEKHTEKLLKEYITLRIESGQFNNADLIEEYVDYKTIGEFNNPEEALFILKAGPYAYGKAYNLLYVNGKQVDSMFMKLPLSERKIINNSIISNTLNEAIRTKSLTMAQNMMNYTRNTWGKNYEEGYKQSQLKILTYYRAVKDTTNFYSQAPYLFDTYMKISADSIKVPEGIERSRIEKILNDQVQEEIKERRTAPKTTGTANTTMFVSSVVTVWPSSYSSIPSQLNNAAWDYFTLGTRNKNHLSKAVLWVKRAIDLKPMPQYYDTLAQLFYRMEFYDEALINQKKAIEMAIQQSMPDNDLRSLKSTEQKIKDRTL
nr:hypothetical protein [Pedobacter panaciterrae]